ncbi:MAG: restriction endonuclease [Ktedonobacterales bacterium]
MKLFFWRRKPQPEQAASPVGAAPVVTTAPASGAVGVLDRGQIPTRPLAMSIELRDALLRFALDCLVTSGARARVEADDLIAAVLPDGTTVRYTTSMTRARAEEETQLLVQGGAALAKLLEDCATHAAVASLHLEAHSGALEIARAHLVAPPAGCGDCARDTGVELCQRCPLRADSFALAGIAKNAAPRVVRQETRRSVELLYTIVSNDRQGRRDEQARLAFDCETGRRLPLLAPEVLADARAKRLPASAAADLDAAQRRAEQALAPGLQAAGALLRLLAEREYRARLGDIQTTSQRLLRESPEKAPAIAEALDQELARLGEVYAVEVDARLESVCFVERPLAALAVSTNAGASIELMADLAAGVLLPPVCAVCGEDAPAATVCGAGHVVCPACQQRQRAPTGLAAGGCLVCAGMPFVGALPAAPVAAPASLSLAHLDAMSEATWRLFVAWLLERDGYRVEHSQMAAFGALDCWTCEPMRGGDTLLAGALRPGDFHALSRDDVERLAALRGSQSTGSCLLISTAAAGTSAREAAQRLGVRLLDREALSVRLDELVARQVHERDAVLRTLEMAAEAATQARTTILGALQRAEEILASAANARKASGRTAVVSAARTLRDAFLSTQRALLAWETLIHDWEAAYDDREARNGSLAVRVDAAAFEEMAARAGHLGDILVAALDAAASTPGVGDLGYAVWRRDVMDALSAQCEEYRWRALSVDPAQWRDFAAAHDVQAYERAGGAATTAAHATERIARSYAELARRARIETSTL